MTELKPCPFCGGKARFAYDGAFELNGICCHACKAMTRFYGLPKPKAHDTYGETMEKWAEVWNRRAT